MKRENFEKAEKIIQKLKGIDVILDGLKSKSIGIGLSSNSNSCGLNNSIPGVWVNDWDGEQKMDSPERIGSNFLYEYRAYYDRLKTSLLKELESL